MTYFLLTTTKCEACKARPYKRAPRPQFRTHIPMFARMSATGVFGREEKTAEEAPMTAGVGELVITGDKAEVIPMFTVVNGYSGEIERDLSIQPRPANPLLTYTDRLTGKVSADSSHLWTEWDGTEVWSGSLAEKAAEAVRASASADVDACDGCRFNRVSCDHGSQGCGRCRELGVACVRGEYLKSYRRDLECAVAMKRKLYERWSEFSGGSPSPRADMTVPFAGACVRMGEVCCTLEEEAEHGWWAARREFLSREPMTVPDAAPDVWPSSLLSGRGEYTLPTQCDPDETVAMSAEYIAVASVHSGVCTEPYTADVVCLGSDTASVVCLERVRKRSKFF